MESLVEREVARTSYYKIGCAIVDFCNYYLEHWEAVSLIKPVGHAKEKATLVMPRPMVDEFAGYVQAKCRSFLPLEGNCQDADDRARLAKYLGKCQRSVTHGGRAEFDRQQVVSERGL